MPEWKQEIRQRLAGLHLAPTREAAIVEELAAHLEDCYTELLSSGAAEAEAERRTMAELSIDLYVPAYAARRAGVRSPARPARDANRPGLNAQRRRGGVQRTPDALAVAQWSGGGAGGALDGLACRIGTASA